MHPSHINIAFNAETRTTEVSLGGTTTPLTTSGKYEIEFSTKKEALSYAHQLQLLHEVPIKYFVVETREVRAEELYADSELELLTIPF